MINKLTLYEIIITLSLLITCAVKPAQAGPRFVSSYSCSDAVKTCVSTGTKEIEGFSVHRDCWKWAYSKKCNYPSKNDCAQHGHCYSLGQRDCLMRDTLGNCINIQKEFSCKRWEPTFVEEERVRYGLEDKDGTATLVCKGIPCIDGNCVDKSYEMDEDMVKSVSQLGAMSKGKDSAMGIKIFEGIAQQCSKKGNGWHNCCKVFPKGWGKNLGAKCTEDERILSDRRQNNLCVDAGTSKIKGIAGTSFGRKHHYCCFGNILEKVIQKEARKQLGRSFGDGGRTDCSGLSLEDLERVDFSQMDFSEVSAYFLKKITLPDVGDIADGINSAYGNTTKFDHEHPGDEKNKLAGVNWNRDIMGATPEEQRIEAERLERERLAKLEAERLEKERLARLEAERLEAIRLAEIEAERVKKIRIDRMVKVEAEVATKQREYDRDFAHWTALGVEYQRLWNEYLTFHKQPEYTNAKKPASYYQYLNRCDEYNSLRPQIQKQEQELRRLKAELARLR